MVTAEEEEAHEKDDINKVLDDLNLSAVNNRAFSISQESQVLIQKFTVILKDLVNGVPTAYDDLTHLLDNSQETLEKSYEQLPGFLKKLIVSLPTKLTGSLAPELLAVASEAQGLNAAGASAAGSAGLGAAAKSFLTPTGLRDLVTKPGAVVSMLKAIMNALKLRWPAFMGTNVLLSLGLFGTCTFSARCHESNALENITNLMFQSFFSYSGTATNEVAKSVSRRKAPLNWSILMVASSNLRMTQCSLAPLEPQEHQLRLQTRTKGLLAVLDTAPDVTNAKRESVRKRPRWRSRRSDYEDMKDMRMQRE